jgi:hypothetical protein
MSSALASGTLNATSSVPASITSIVASDDGSTQEPPMKKRSGWAIGAVVERVTADLLALAMRRAPTLVRCVAARSGPGRRTLALSPPLLRIRGHVLPRRHDILDDG